MPAEEYTLSLEAEIARQRSAERDQLNELLVSRRRAWIAALLALSVALITAASFLAMLPRLGQPPKLHVVRVDNATGMIEHVTALADAQEDYGERMSRFWLQQYVLACESYDWHTIQNTYERCGLLSSPERQRAFYALFQGDQALDKRYGNQTRVRVAVQSITLGPKQTAVVRFRKRIEHSNALLEEKQLVATVAYTYVNAPMTEQIARDNPLGFIVLSYQVDEEIVK